MIVALAFDAAGTHIWFPPMSDDKESHVPTKAEKRLKARMEDKLDQALRDSFPASDPVSFLEPGPPSDSERKLPFAEAAARGKAGLKGKGKATRS